MGNMLSSLHDKYYDFLIWLGADPLEEVNPIPTNCLEGYEPDQEINPECDEEKKYLAKISMPESSG